MIALDKVKQKIPLEWINLNTSIFEAKHLSKHNKLVHHLKPDYKKPLGISYIEYDEDHLILIYSAKILKQHYPDLITSDTIELVIATLEDSNILSINIDHFLDSTCLLSDTTKNINVVELNSSLVSTPSDCVNMLAMMPKPNKYIVVTHNSPSNVGIEITKRLRSGNRRLIGYGKRIELERNNDTILDYLLPNEFQNTFRLEANITTFEQHRKYYGIKHNTLGEVLKASQNPLEHYFNDYSSRVNNMKIDNLTRAFKYSVYKNQLAIRDILEMHNGDLESIKAWALHNGYTTRSNVSKFMKQYESEKLKLEQNNIGSDVNKYKELIKEMSYQLSN